MEATCLSETSVDFQQIARRYIPEDRAFFNTQMKELMFPHVKKIGMRI
jgi:hypothetical protein